MKKIIALLLAAILITVSAAALYSCNGTEGKGGDTSDHIDESDSKEVNDTTENNTNGNTDTGSSEGNETMPSNDIDLQPKIDISSVTGTEGVNDEEGAVNIFDGDSTTKWCVRQEEISVEWKMTEPVTIDYYYFTTANDAPERNPASWILYGSSDGANWSELSKVEDAELPEDFFTDSKQFAIENPASFEYYMLEINSVAVPGSNITQFSEFNFYQAAK